MPFIIETTDGTPVEDAGGYFTIDAARGMAQHYAATLGRAVRVRHIGAPEPKQVRWYTWVGFGACAIPRGAYRTRGEANDAYARHAWKSNGAQRDPSGYTDANARLYCYDTRAQARDGAIGDDVGQRGRIG